MTTNPFEVWYDVKRQLPINIPPYSWNTKKRSNISFQAPLTLFQNKNFKILFFSILLTILSLNSANAQVGINNPLPDPSSMLDVKSVDKGVLLPRVTTFQRKNDITSPAKGLLVYDTDLDLFYFNAGNSVTPTWVPINTGYYASKTRIKIIPKDFMAAAKDKHGKPQPKTEGYDNVSGTNTNYGVVTSEDDTDLVSFVAIPSGFKATHVRIYGNDTSVSFNVYESNIVNGNLFSKGSANLDSEANITDVNSSDTNFLVISIHFDDKEEDKAYGGYVTIAPI